MTRLIRLCAEPFRELDRATLLDEARTAAVMLFVLTMLGVALRVVA